MWVRTAFQSIVHPVCFAVWPVAALYAQNAERYPVSVVLVPSAVFIFMAAALYVGAWLVFRNAVRSGLFASLVVIAFHVLWKPVIQDRVVPAPGVPSTAIYVLYSVLVVLIAAWLLRKSEAFQLNATRGLTVLSVVLLLLPAVQGAANYSPGGDGSDGALPPVDLEAVETFDSAARPNVVLLILDGYGRSDLLEERFGFDNRAFEDALEARGFVVATNSTSNYNTTNWSLPSFLNLDYLDALGLDGGDEKGLSAAIRRHRALEYFKALGYDTYAFSTGYEISDPGKGTDHVIHSRYPWFEFSEFEYAAAEFNPVAGLVRAAGFDFAHRAWYSRIVFTLNNLHRPLVNADGPVYVWAHVVAPHWPFVFEADGGPRYTEMAFTLREQPGVFESAESRNETVQNQIQGLNKHVLEAADRVFGASNEPPIFLIVSDHSPGDGTPMPREMRNFCAVYLPDAGSEIDAEVLDSLTLVNVFRVVFNTYFGGEFPLLETRTIGAAEVLREGGKD